MKHFRRVCGRLGAVRRLVGAGALRAAICLKVQGSEFRVQGSRFLLPAVLALVCFVITSQAVVPPPDKLLPDDTLVVVTAPDFVKLRDLYHRSAQGQLWNDPAMKPF